MGRIRNTCRSLFRKPQERKYLKDMDIDGRTILNVLEVSNTVWEGEIC
jgi:hypothetical protein